MKTSRKLLINIAVILIIIIGIAVYFRLTTESSPENAPTGGPADDSGITVETGDRVTIDYLGRLEDGTVFDTSNEGYAKKYGIYDKNKQYGAMTMTVGNGQLIKGFERGLLGMKLKEQRRIRVAPEEGYGRYDPTKTRTMPRLKEINRTIDMDLKVNIPAKQFIDVFGKDPVKGDIVHGKVSPWAYTVVDVKGDTVMIKAVVAAGESYALPKTGWNATVLRVDSNKAVLRQDPREKLVDTEIGKAALNVTDSKIRIFLMPRVGEIVKTKDGKGAIKAFDDKSVTIDVNHPLAGKTLLFDAYITGLVKKY